MPEYHPKDLLNPEFFIALSLSVQFFTRFKPMTPRLFDLYTLTRDYIAWSALIFRLWKNRNPVDDIMGLVSFISENSTVHIAPEQATNSLYRPLSPRIVAQVVNETSIEKVDVNNYYYCYPCCYKDQPPGCRQNFASIGECFMSCMSGRIS
jgi:hypothetical protein